MIALAVVKTDSLSNIAYKYILEQILTFRFKPNEAIIENDICSTLQISRTPLREALRRLEAEGFVIKARNRGTFVKPYTPEDITEIYDIRKVFEMHALKNCIVAVTPGEIEDVRRKILLLNESSPPDDFFKSDDNLHNMIIRYCMNSRMSRILKSLTVQLGIVQTLSSQGPNRFQQVNDEHLQILNAIEQRNLTQASALLELHLEIVKQCCLQTYKKMQIKI